MRTHSQFQRRSQNSHSLTKDLHSKYQTVFRQYANFLIFRQLPYISPTSLYFANLFIFRQRPFHISISISALPVQYTNFISLFKFLPSFSFHSNRISARQFQQRPVATCMRSLQLCRKLFFEPESLQYCLGLSHQFDPTEKE